MAETPSEQRLLILIARDEAVLDEMLAGMLDAGLTGATILESRGLGAILREDTPIFAGLAALLPQHTGSRVVLALTTHANIDRLREFIEEMPREQRPIAIEIPVESAFGIDTGGKG